MCSHYIFGLRFHRCAVTGPKDLEFDLRAKRLAVKISGADHVVVNQSSSFDPLLIDNDDARFAMLQLTRGRTGNPSIKCVC
jgi:hypothetical protein